MNTNRDGPPSMTNRARMHLRYRDLDITTSWEEAHPGARASRPHNTGRASPISSTPDRPAKTPGLCFSRAHAVPAGTVAGCAIAGKLSDNPKQRMRAGRPRSRVGRFRHDCPSRESPAQPNRLDGRLESRFDNPFVVLRVPSWITLFPFLLFVDRPQLFRAGGSQFLQDWRWYWRMAGRNLVLTSMWASSSQRLPKAVALDTRAAVR